MLANPYCLTNLLDKKIISNKLSRGNKRRHVWSYQTDEGYFVRLHDTGGFQTDIDDEIYTKTKSKIIDQISTLN